jgi:hypothetical protein
VRVHRGTDTTLPRNPPIKGRAVPLRGVFGRCFVFIVENIAKQRWKSQQPGTNTTSIQLLRNPWLRFTENTISIKLDTSRLIKASSGDYRSSFILIVFSVKCNQVFPSGLSLYIVKQWCKCLVVKTSTSA